MTETPSTYPSRGRWRFYNITGNFYFYPPLQSIGITQEHPDLTATLNCAVVDNGEGFAFQSEDEVRVTFGGDRIFAGHIKTLIEGSPSEDGPKSWTITAQDYTGKLGQALVTRRRKRKREKAKRRIKWILRYMTRHVWQLDGMDLSHVPDENVEPYDYYGTTVEEALQHVADQVRCHFYIDLDNVFQWFRTDAVPGPFYLDNDAPDYVNSFPFQGWADTYDTVDLGNAVLMDPERRKDAVWVKDADSISAFRRHERFVSDSNIHRRKAARNVARRALEENLSPTAEASITVYEPGLWAGMQVHVVEDLWRRDEWRYIKSVNIRAVDAHDEDFNAFLVTEITLQNRRKRRGHVHRSINRNTRRRPGTHANVKDYVIDSFHRVVEPPELEPGDAMGSMATYQVSKGVDVNGNDIPFDIGTPVLQLAASYVGAGYMGWTTEDCGCPGLDNCFKGWKDIERWAWMVVPAHPDGMAGATIDVSVPGLDGVAGSHGADVVVLTSQPTDTWQGTVVGHVGSSGGTVTIPASAIPAEGGELHIGLRAGWHCNYGDFECGWSWPFSTGDGNSGRYRASLSNPTWLIASGAIEDFGTIAAAKEAPWDGGNTWVEAGVEGSPTYGIDGSAYYVTATSPAGRGMYMVGQREDDDQAWGPWSDVGWAVDVLFSVDVVGDTGTAGPRSIEVRTSGEGEKAIGTVWLGDSSMAPGISVGGPTGTDYDAVTLTPDDPWKFIIDTRANRVRGKLWRVSDGEPADWNVEVPMEETEDDYDRWSLWVRCGQVGGQTVRIRDIRARDSAHDGQRVDKEYIGHASGSTNKFTTCHPFRPGTLRVYVNGVGVGTSWEDGDNAVFRLDRKPTRKSILRASYTVDQGEGDDE